MPQTQVGNLHKVTASAGKNINGGDDDGAGYNDADQLTEDALNTRLQAIDSSLYTDTHLEQMTRNDKVYALRVNDDPGTIAQSYL